MKILLALTLTMSGVALFSPPVQAQPPKACESARLAPADSLIANNQVRNDLPPTEAKRAEQATALVGNEQELAAHVNEGELLIDNCGLVFYKDSLKFEPTESKASASVPSNLTQAEVFSLESKPGASKTIYLNFVGANLTNTSWNDYSKQAVVTVDAYNVDNVSGFSTLELNNIYKVYKTMEEDYAPFNINITTKPPVAGQLTKESSTDPTYGLQAFFTQSPSVVRNLCGCNGIAGLGNFGLDPATFNYNNTSWAFADRVFTPENLGQVGSHEAGHSLGLNHDGSVYTEYHAGDGLWSPIMGTSYDTPLNQWSKGEYSNANNRQDDTAIIANAVGYMADDYGNSINNAQPIANGTANGRIETAGDIDVFSFVAQGQTIAHVRLPMFANVKASLKIYNATGGLVFQENEKLSKTTDFVKAAGMEASAYLELMPGQTYYAVVEGVGWTYSGVNLSDYGSIGNYQLYLETGVTGKPLTFVPSVMALGYEGTSYRTRAANLEGGVQPYSYSSPKLPAGLTLDAATGFISGTPTAWTFTTVEIIVTDATGAQVSSILPLNIEVPPYSPELKVVSVSLAQGEVNKAYKSILVATGGNNIFEWSASNLPPGLRVSGQQIVGTPTKAGTYRVVMLVKSYPFGSVKAASKAFNVTIAPATLTPVFVTKALPKGKKGRVYQTTIKVKNATRYTKYKILKGQFPPGVRMELNAKAPTSINVAGRPKKPGKFKITLRATNGTKSATKTYLITIVK